MHEKYSEFSYAELRELLLCGELEHEFMTDEDYADIIENELEQVNPSIDVLDLCVEGLSQYEEYKALKDMKIDLNTIFLEKPDKNKKIINTRAVKAALIAAIIIVFMLVSQLISLAFGFNLFGYIFNWGDEKVYIEAIPNGEASDFTVIPEYFMYENIDAVPNEYLSYIPKNIQSDYIFAEASYLDAGEGFIFLIAYSGHPDIYLTLNVNNSINTTIEKDDEHFEEYIVSGITYTLYKNLDYYKALWLNDGLLFDMSVNLSLDEVKKIIDNF